MTARRREEAFGHDEAAFASIQSGRWSLSSVPPDIH
jgi:hypothetical protein